MVRLLVAVAILPVLFLAGCSPDEPQPPAKDYQKFADEAKWDPPADDFQRCLAHQLTDYTVEMTRAKGSHWEVILRVTDSGKEVYSWKGHLSTVFFERDGVLYHADFSQMSTGCAVVAFDLKAKKQLWRTDLKGVGPVDHSKYRNEVRMGLLDADAVVVYGHESDGKYVEILDLKTGKTVGHKVFKEEKGKAEK